MWELASALLGRPDMVEGYLKEGYEPFTVSMNTLGFPVIWLKRNLKEVSPPIEIHSQRYEPVKRTGRRAAKKPKG